MVDGYFEKPHLLEKKDGRLSLRYDDESPQNDSQIRNRPVFFLVKRKISEACHFIHRWRHISDKK